MTCDVGRQQLGGANTLNWIWDWLECIPFSCGAFVQCLCAYFSLSFFRCSISYLGHRTAISQVIVASSQLFWWPYKRKKPHISCVINAENKSATKHKNKTLCCRIPLLLLFCLCENLWIKYSILEAPKKRRNFKCGNWTEKNYLLNIVFLFSLNVRFLFSHIHFVNVKQEEQKVLLNHRMIKKSFFSASLILSSFHYDMSRQTRKKSINTQ